MFGLLWTARNCCAGKYVESEESSMKGLTCSLDVITGIVLAILGGVLIAGIYPLLSIGTAYAVSAGIGGALLFGGGGLNLCLSIPVACCGLLFRDVIKSCFPSV